MEIMIFLALLYIAVNMPTDGQLSKVIRLLKENQSSISEASTSAAAEYDLGYRKAVEEIKAKQSKAADKPTVDRRKR